MISIGFTGTRHGMTSKQKTKMQEIIKHFNIKRAHHGDCVGADKDFHNLISARKKEKNIEIVIHPPNNPKYRSYCNGDIFFTPKDYIERNHDIVRGTDILLATPDCLEKVRSGTWATIRFARKLKRKIIIIMPDGAIKDND